MTKILLKQEELIDLHCHHCGDCCTGDYPVSVNYCFCCNGCQLIFTLLTEQGLDQYYRLNNQPGISQKKSKYAHFEILEDPEIIASLLSYQSPQLSKIRIELPQIHCSSCVWLLENLFRLNPGVTQSRVNFLEKTLSINYNPKVLELKDLFLLLSKIGYEPTLNFDDLNKKPKLFTNKPLLYKIGLAGFSFGNIMLLSFPEYLGFENATKHFYLGYINLILATPVLIYSAQDFVKSAWTAFKTKSLSIDTPIVIGMIALFVISLFEIVLGLGEGYLDSFTGFIFFLLIGRWFQDFSFSHLSFDRNYKSFFPIAVLKSINSSFKAVSIDGLSPDDLIKINNETIIPCDSILVSQDAMVDYSFVTGEDRLIELKKGEILYAGGKLIGKAVECIVVKKVNQSYLTQLWNDSSEANFQSSSTSTRLVDFVSHYFTLAILTISILSLLFWLIVDPSLALKSFSSVLIIACPCVLALSVPFLYGNALRLLSTMGIYVKNTGTLERLANINDIVFDKTGTLTDTKSAKVDYYGKRLSTLDHKIIRTITAQSKHPLSFSLYNHFDNIETTTIEDFEEIIGYGIKAIIANKKIRLGSAQFILNSDESPKEQLVFLEVDGSVRGYFQIQSKFRKGVSNVISNLSESYNISLISGDNDSSRSQIEQTLPEGAEIHFNCTPISKLKYIKERQNLGNKVLMIGDGLNDAGALRQSDVGIVLSDDNNSFTPASDIIYPASHMGQLNRFIGYAKFLHSMLFGAFLLAFIYNIIGLGFAVTGNLSPLVAAILMPSSSIAIMTYGMIASKLYFLNPQNKITSSMS